MALKLPRCEKEECCTRRTSSDLPCIWVKFSENPDCSHNRTELLTFRQTSVQSAVFKTGPIVLHEMRDYS